MDILTVFLIVVAIEAGIYGICCIMCREKHDSGETGTRSKITSHHSDLHPPRMTHEVEHQQTWSHANERPSNRQENNDRMTCFPSHISSLRDCE